MKKRGSIMRSVTKTQELAADTFYVSRLALELLEFFGFGYLWIVMAIRLLIFGMLVTPGLLRTVYRYIYSRNIIRDVVYGPHSRNKLDIYLPNTPKGQYGEPCPVVIFVSGGAWIIGNKVWAALLGQNLALQDIILVSIDYRNFPQGTISDMEDDISSAMGWINHNIDYYGGDPSRMHLIGQSAGAHITSLVLLKQCLREHTFKSDNRADPIQWSVSQLQSWVGISGPYNMEALAPHLHQKGLYKNVMLTIMEAGFFEASPSRLLRSSDMYQNNPALSLLPPIYLFHGSKDATVPESSSLELAFVLAEKGISVNPVMYPGSSHTDPILEGPLLGHNVLLQDIILIIQGRRVCGGTRPMQPRFLTKLARQINPF